MLICSGEAHQRRGHRDVETLASPTMGNRHPGIRVESAIQSVGLVAHDDADLARQVGAIDVDGTMRIVRRRGDDPIAGGSDLIERATFHDRHVEECTGRRADHLWIRRIDATVTEYHRRCPCSLSGAQDGAEVPRVAHGVTPHDPVSLRRRPSPQGSSNDGKGRLRSLRVGDSLENARSQREAVRIGPGKAHASIGNEDLLDLPAGRDRLGDQRRSLDDERIVLQTRTAAPDEAPQSLNSWMGKGQVSVAQTSAPLAVSTNLANAAASLTARSARILRSTSTPAFDNPAINRL